LNCPEFPDSRLARQLLTGIDIGKVLTDRSNIDSKQLSHQLLCQPDGLIFIPYLDASLARLPGENQKLGGAVADESIAHFCLPAECHVT
jgi:hypothetical protein